MEDLHKDIYVEIADTFLKEELKYSKSSIFIPSFNPFILFKLNDHSFGMVGSLKDFVSNKPKIVFRISKINEDFNFVFPEILSDFSFEIGIKLYEIDNYDSFIKYKKEFLENKKNKEKDSFEYRFFSNVIFSQKSFSKKNLIKEIILEYLSQDNRFDSWLNESITILKVLTRK